MITEMVAEEHTHSMNSGTKELQNSFYLRADKKKKRQMFVNILCTTTCSQEDVSKGKVWLTGTKALGDKYSTALTINMQKVGSLHLKLIQAFHWE